MKKFITFLLASILASSCIFYAGCTDGANSDETIQSTDNSEGTIQSNDNQNLDIGTLLLSQILTDKKVDILRVHNTKQHQILQKINKSFAQIV